MHNHHQAHPGYSEMGIFAGYGETVEPSAAPFNACFPRPANAICDYTDLSVGDMIWKVYGTWRPFASDCNRVISRPVLYREHRECHDPYDPLAVEVVFDVEHTSGITSGITSLEFAADSNLVPGQVQYSNNYWFRSQADADAAVAYLHQQWLARPDLIERLSAAHNTAALLWPDFFDPSLHEDIE